MKITLLNTLLNVHSKICKTVKACTFTRVVPSPYIFCAAMGPNDFLVKVPPHLSRSRRKFEGDIREGSLSWVTTWTPVRNQTVSLFNSVRNMCGRLVGGVGPKMKSCYLLRVKQRLAFCCPLLPNKIFFVFWNLRLLPGVLFFHKWRWSSPKAHMCVQSVCKRVLFQHLSVTERLFSLVLNRE